MDCEICCEKFNKVTRKQITCNACEKVVCKKCIVSWNNEKTDIMCPLCNNTFSYEFCYKNLGRTYMNKCYSSIIKEILFKKEVEFMNETQVYIELFEKKKEIENEYLHFQKIFMRVKDLKADPLRKNKYVLDFFNGIQQSETKLTKKFIIDTMKNNLIILKRKYECYNEAYINANIDLVKEYDVNITKMVKNKPLCPCPENNCKGFIKSTNGECGLCKVKICKNCFVKYDNDDHVCDEKDIESVKSIIKETKPCPNCATRISKIDGCDQMYCIQCDTAFSWKTGNIETGKIHNPHYYEKLRNSGLVIPREPGDNPNCDEPAQLNMTHLLNFIKTRLTPL